MSNLTPELKPGHKHEYNFEPWNLFVSRNHILQSSCQRPEDCNKVTNEVDFSQLCQVCRFDKLVKTPRLPDMVFPDNVLRITHKNGFGFEFNTLDALKHVNPIEESNLKVSSAEAWNEARSECEFINTIVKPFDWTFTTSYKGSLFCQEGKQFNVSPSNLKINYDRLKQKDIIMYYECIHLYEDELSDNGVASCEVKVRVMPSCFLVLHRFYLRIDNVLIRIHDTRIYHQDDEPYFLREYTRRESNIKDLKVPVEIWRDPNAVGQYLPLLNEETEMIHFPV